ncbi:hypothetical protein BG000_005813 [Podila horticola]|nr:hypothetical protein BG000_005813 [Podila horticola]
MTITSIHSEPVPRGSGDITRYQQLMKPKPVKLFKLEYNQVVPQNLSGPEWNPVHLFHGSEHCGRVTTHAVEALSTNIINSSWYSTESCAVRGILRHGHLLMFSKDV